MRNLNNYEVVFCDIDNTLIYGNFVQLLDIAWKLFNSKLIAKFLIFLQAKFKLYKVSQKLLYMLKNFNGNLVFLTARGEQCSTIVMLNDILGDQPFIVEQLGSSIPSIDKYIYILNNLENFSTACLIDDNKETIDRCRRLLEIDVYDGAIYHERVIDGN